MPHDLNVSDEDPNALSQSLTLPAVLIRKAVIFPIPQLPIPLTVTQSRTLAAIERALSEKSLIFIATATEDEDEDEDDPDGHGDNDQALCHYSYGMIARVLEVFEDQEEGHEVLIEGLGRGRITDTLEHDPFLYVSAERVEEVIEEGPELEALTESLKELARAVISLSPRLPDEVAEVLDHIDDPGPLSDLIASQVGATLEQKQEILEELNINVRIKSVIKLLSRERSVLELSQEIHSEVRDSLNEHQKEVFLREQMKAIQKKLGDEDDERGDLRERILKANMPEAVEQVALREHKRMGMMSTQSAEFTVSRSYVDWLLDIPWSTISEDTLDLGRAGEVLDSEHYGLEKVKRRILEFLAVCKLKGEVRGPILCLVGPPGVGKTSLGKSIAEALGRSFVRISLGGVRDEAEIRGHRRTYIGSLPGRFVKALKKAGSMNPVICLDEIDKLGQDFRGDPGSALLEVLDPEQNYAFSDHYLEVPVDLSKVLFFTTANRLDTIPPALKDRLEVLEIPGYLQEEKVAIARTHLLPQILEDHGLSDELATVEEEALDTLISQYTREAGVRALSRHLSSVIRSVAFDIATEELSPPINVDLARVRKALGPQKVFPESAETMDAPGVSIGLAWTPVGGEILFIEATLMKGSGKLTLTGQLGEVMKESAHAAMSLLHTRAEELGLDEANFTERNIHLHLPSGAIPKDGPSAGVAIVVALASLLLGRPMKDGMAMTGEITLRGRVLPVGGIKEKVIAAARAGMREVILPKNNAGDLEEIPEPLKEQVTFHFIDRVEEALALTLNVRSQPSSTS